MMTVETGNAFVLDRKMVKMATAAHWPFDVNLDIHRIERYDHRFLRICASCALRTPTAAEYKLSLVDQGMATPDKKAPQSRLHHCI